VATPSLWRRGAWVLLGTVLLAFAFPAVWWWRVTHTMSRALANEAPLPAGVTLTDTELVVGEQELRNLVERVP
jgi:hypothetical protein